MNPQNATQGPRGISGLALPADLAGLPKVMDEVSRVCAADSFSPAQTGEIVEATQEACQQLIRYSHEVNSANPLTLSITMQDQACTVDLSFNQQLDRLVLLRFPRQSSQPRANAISNVDLPPVWHEVIAPKMDRVFLVADGRQRTIRMIKYQRTEAQAGLSWLMVITPRLREDLAFHVYRDAEGQPESSLLQDEKSGVELKFNRAMTRILNMIDGQRTFYEIYLAYTDQYSFIAPQQLEDLFHKLEGAGMLAGQDPRTGQGKTGRRAWLSNLVFVLPHADRFVTRLHGRLRLLFSPLAFGLFIAFCLSGFIPLIGQVKALHELLLLPSIMIAEQPVFLLHVYAIVLISLFLHELAHGLTCKHFGGDVNRFGAMFILGMFAFFCDTSSSWNFPEKHKRVLVALAGPLVNLFFMSLCFWAWWFTKASASLANSFWFIAGCVSLILSLANLIPFIKLDGYFILMDLTGIANLREKSFHYLKDLLLSIFRRRQEPQAAGGQPSGKWTMLIYGLLSVPVTVFFLAIPFIEFYVVVWREHQSHFRAILLGTILVFLIIAFGRRLYDKLWQHYHRVYEVPARTRP